MVHTKEMEFYCAAVAGNLSAVDSFLEERNNEDDDGNNTNDEHNVIDVSAQSFAGHTVLHGACNVHRSGVVQALLQRPKIRSLLLNAQDERHRRTPLQTCIVVGHEDLAYLLIQEYDADVMSVDEDNRTALHLACYYKRSWGLIRCLLERMQRQNNIPFQQQLWNSPDDFGKTPLLYACDAGNVGVVEYMLDRLVVSPQLPSLTTWDWDLALVRGARVVPAYQQVAQLVLNAGIVIQPQLPARRPYKIHEELLAWINKVQQDPEQQLRTAAAQGNIKQLQSLLLSSSYEAHSSRVGCSQHNTPEWTALHSAARWGHTAACSVLLHAGVSPMVPNENGQTPVQIAVEYGHLSVVEEILRHVVLGR